MIWTEHGTDPTIHRARLRSPGADDLISCEVISVGVAGKLEAGAFRAAMRNGSTGREWARGVDSVDEGKAWVAKSLDAFMVRTLRG